MGHERVHRQYDFSTHQSQRASNNIAMRAMVHAQWLTVFINYQRRNHARGVQRIERVRSSWSSRCQASVFPSAFPHVGTPPHTAAWDFRCTSQSTGDLGFICCGAGPPRSRPVCVDLSVSRYAGCPQCCNADVVGCRMGCKSRQR